MGPNKVERNPSGKCMKNNGNHKAQRAQAQWAGVKGHPNTRPRGTLWISRDLQGEAEQALSHIQRAKQIDSIKAGETVVRLWMDFASIREQKAGDSRTFSAPLH